MLQMRDWRSTAACVLAACVLAACASRIRTPAPVEERSSGARPPVTTATAPTPVESRLPGAENAGKPGYYTVRPGDTLIRIALDAGQNWRDISRWNNIENPNVIEVGQVVRVIPPVTAAATAITPSTSRPPATPASSAATAAGSPARSSC